ncbi:MAG TPA: hypothetical protein VNO21_08130 [Polyangiaceae bacterium]|nr:hypothetical protein [Polyangiaceae bacterium]
MPDEDDKNLAAVPASDSVPPDAPTVVTEFPRHLIEALAQAAGVAPRPAPATPPARDNNASVAPVAPAPRASAPTAVVTVPPSVIDAHATVEVPVAIDAFEPPNRTPRTPPKPVESGKPQRADKPHEPDKSDVSVTKSDIVPAAFTKAAPLDDASASFPTDAEQGEDVEVDEDIELEPYESPSQVTADLPVPTLEWPSPAPPAAPSEFAAPTAHLWPELATEVAHPPAFEGSERPSDPSVPASPFSARRAAMGFGAGKGEPVWAEPPPPAISMGQPSALGWAIGGILGALGLLALLVWLLYLVVRHFI